MKQAAMNGSDGVNKDFNISQIYQIQLTDNQFRKISQFIQNETGIKLPEIKKTMLQSRLHKRLRALKMDNFKDYINFALKKGNEQEIINMIDVVSTNKTDFYREPNHFDFLTNEYIPFLVRNRHSRIKIWSAASSSGEEPYTLAIVMQLLKERYAELSYSIMATDISTRMLEHGKKTIYSEDKIEQIPLSVKKKFFLRSVDRNKPSVKVVPDLQNKIQWQRLNLMDDYYKINERFDIIFCRNVLIYF
ncbi:MAG: hypothetical protein MI922_18135, partial [Bacteroidales bacterium]|nr:hypothetical protein [Bacteroidales bacterium]